MMESASFVITPRASVLGTTHPFQLNTSLPIAYIKSHETNGAGDLI